MLKCIRRVGSLAFVLGFFSVVFVVIPWYVTVLDNATVGGPLRPAKRRCLKRPVRNILQKSLTIVGTVTKKSHNPWDGYPKIILLPGRHILVCYRYVDKPSTCLDSRLA